MLHLRQLWFHASSIDSTFCPACLTTLKKHTYFSQPLRVLVVRRVMLATLDWLEPSVCVAQWDLMGRLALMDYLWVLESCNSGFQIWHTRVWTNEVFWWWMLRCIYVWLITMAQLNTCHTISYQSAMCNIPPSFLPFLSLSFLPSLPLPCLLPPPPPLPACLPACLLPLLMYRVQMESLDSMASLGRPELLWVKLCFTVWNVGALVIHVHSYVTETQKFNFRYQTDVLFHWFNDGVQHWAILPSHHLPPLIHRTYTYPPSSSHHPHLPWSPWPCWTWWCQCKWMDDLAGNKLCYINT